MHLFRRNVKMKKINRKIPELSCSISNYPYVSINELLLPTTKTITPLTTNKAPMTIAIRIGCDAAKTARATVNIPKIKLIIERTVYDFP